MIFNDIKLVLNVYFLSLIFGIVSWPSLSLLFKNFSDKGWAMGRIVGSLVISLIVWWVASLGWSVNTEPGILVVGSVWALGNVYVLIKYKGEVMKNMGRAIKFVVIEEYLFACGLVFMSIVRGFGPEIESLEKFMDFGFVNRYIYSPTLPAQDMWMAGSQINYYSFGHFWASVVIRMLGLVPTVGYNIMLAVIMGLTLSMTFSIVINLVSGVHDRAKLVGGLIGSMSVALAGNGHVIWYFLKNHTLVGYWYAEATRLIFHTIHEFPSYSFVVSDLHGHLLDLPIVLGFILIMVAWVKEKKWWYEFAMGGFMGIMIMTNTWDFPIYGLLLLVYGTTGLIRRKIPLVSLLRAAWTMIVISFVVSLSWWLGFNNISGGIGFVQERSPLWQLAILWLGGLVVCIIAIIVFFKENERAIVYPLVFTALLLIAIPEIIYAKDIYTTYPRANTMFKLTYQSFVLLGIIMGVCYTKLIVMGRRRHFLTKLPLLVVLSVLFAGTMIFPAEAFTTYYGNFEKYISLDGEKWLKEKDPERYGAVVYLRNHRDGKNMVEAVGDSYTNSNAVSVFSATPTVLGWRVHEWLWRGGYSVVAEKEGVVKSIYEYNGDIGTIDAIKSLDIGWILVGKEEREKYAINDLELQKLGEVVWQEAGTYLVRINVY